VAEGSACGGFADMAALQPHLLGVQECVFPVEQDRLLGAAGTGLDIDEAVVRVGRVGEHAAEFERGDARLDVLHVGGDAVQAVVVILGLRHLEQFGGVVEILADLGQAEHHVFQRLALAAKVLGAFRIVPDGRVFGELIDFG